MKILLVGQGIAGTMLAFALRRRGVEVHLMDGDLPGSSSAPAAGIINPVTGKRFVKSWRFDEFFPIAKTIYQEMERELGIEIWDERPTLRLLHTPEEINDWSVRCAQPDYQDQLSETVNSGHWGAYLKPGFSFGFIRQSARVKLPVLIAAYRQKALREGIFLAQNFEIREVDTWLEQYDRLVFCEGWRANSNPYFPEASFKVCKGQALIFRFLVPSAGPVTLPETMLKKNILVTALGEGAFWAGSTYEWDFKDAGPDQAGREFLLQHLKDMFDAQFELLDQVAGIRPSTIDRRPLCLRSQVNPKLFMFNGLGTKGALLAPFFAENIADSICSS